MPPRSLHPNSSRHGAITIRALLARQSGRCRSGCDVSRGAYRDKSDGHCVALTAAPRNRSSSRPATGPGVASRRRRLLSSRAVRGLLAEAAADRARAVSPPPPALAWACALVDGRDGRAGLVPRTLDCRAKPLPGEADGTTLAPAVAPHAAAPPGRHPEWAAARAGEAPPSGAPRARRWWERAHPAHRGSPPATAGAPGRSPAPRWPARLQPTRPPARRPTVAAAGARQPS